MLKSINSLEKIKEIRSVDIVQKNYINSPSSANTFVLCSASEMFASPLPQPASQMYVLYN